MNTHTAVYDLLSEIPVNASATHSGNPLVEWDSQDAPLKPTDAEDLLEHLKTAGGDVVCHFESAQKGWWLRYLPERECFDWHVDAADEDGSYDQLDDIQSTAVARLQSPLREGASLSLYRSTDAPVTFASADRDVEQLPPEAFAQPEEPVDREDDQPDPAEYHPGTDDPRFPNTHDEFSDLA